MHPPAENGDKVSESGMQSQSQWYQADDDKPCLDAAHEAFHKAVDIFSSTMTKDPKKEAAVQGDTSLEDVRRTVIEAKTRYDTAHEHSKISKWLSRFSNRVQFYENILDLLVQHHPEYVSSAWGAMKFLFVIELVTVLYPTTRLKQAVSELYANPILYASTRLVPGNIPVPILENVNRLREVLVFVLEHYEL